MSAIQFSAPGTTGFFPTPAGVTAVTTVTVAGLTATFTFNPGVGVTVSPAPTAGQLVVIDYEDPLVASQTTVVNPTARPARVADTTLRAGENQPLDLQEMSMPGAFVSGGAVTSGADILLGSPGASGNKLYAIGIFNGSASAFTACTLWDGATQVDWLTLGMTTLAAGAFATWTPPGGVLESKNGGWRLRITCTGTMANIRWGAVVAE